MHGGASCRSFPFSRALSLSLSFRLSLLHTHARAQYGTKGLNKWVTLEVPPPSQTETDAEGEMDGGEVRWYYTIKGRSLLKAYVVRVRCSASGNQWSKWSTKTTIGRGTEFHLVRISLSVALSRSLLCVCVCVCVCACVSSLYSHAADLPVSSPYADYALINASGEKSLHLTQ